MSTQPAARPLRRGGLAAAIVVALTVLVALSGGVPARSAGSRESPAAGWQGLLGVRPVPQLGDREIVVLRLPSLADRVREAGGVATEAQEKAWTREAQRAQQHVLQALATFGVPVDPEQSYVRV